jgi:ubiquitin domain-containing protein
MNLKEGLNFIHSCAKLFLWSPEFTKIAAVQTYRALYCKALAHSEFEVSVPPLIDQIWHEMILETKDYREFCKGLGKFLEHSKRMANDDLEIKNRRINNLATIWSNVYPDVPMDAECWRREESDAEPVTKKAKHLPNGSFKINIKTTTNKIFTLLVNPATSIGTLTGLVQNSQGVPKEQQRIIFAGKSLHESPEKTVGDFGVKEESTLHLVLRLRGC